MLFLQESLLHQGTHTLVSNTHIFQTIVIKDPSSVHRNRNQSIVSYVHIGRNNYFHLALLGEALIIEGLADLSKWKNDKYIEFK